MIPRALTCRPRVVLWGSLHGRQAGSRADRRATDREYLEWRRYVAAAQRMAVIGRAFGVLAADLYPALLKVGRVAQASFADVNDAMARAAANMAADGSGSRYGKPERRGGI